jgi:CheY-like chemotaxis protein
LARAMEPFFTTKGVGKGTGLGLSMVDGLASQSGGQFVLTSHLGEGTSAELWLPVAPEKVLVAGADPTTDLNTTKEISAPRRSLRILLVDDDPLVLDTTAALLVDLGHQVVSSQAALEALKLIRTDLAFDLVLTDQAMPNMTGTEFLAVVKSMRPAMPTIIATGYADMEPNVAIPAHTIKLSKPFDQAQLATALDAAQAP